MNKPYRPTELARKLVAAIAQQQMAAANVRRRIHSRKIFLTDVRSNVESRR
jgi:hypothetical protein